MNFHDGSALPHSLIQSLELPQDICQGKMKCTIYGNNELLVENSKCILEYSCETILIRGRKSKLQIYGKHLLIAEYTREFIRVCGGIEGIQFV